MSIREATIRVNMKSEGFLAGIRKIESLASTAGTKIGSALSGPMNAGVKRAKGAFSSLESSLKGNIKSAATLGGAFAVGKFISNAMEMKKVYSGIAHDIRKVDSSAKSWKDVQAFIEPVADRTGQKVESIAQAFQTVFEATGNLKYSKSVIEAIGYASTVTGKDTEKYGTLMQMAFRKFGVTAEESGDLIARLDSKLGVGGANIDDLSARFGIMATEASDAGFSGANGMVRLLSTMIAVDNEVGEKAAPALKSMFEKLKANTAQSAALQKRGRFKFTADMDALDKIRETLKTAQGRKAAELTFTGDARRVYDSLIKPFDEGVEEAKKQGKTGKDLTSAGMKKFDDAMKQMGAEGESYAKLQAEANKKIEGSYSVILRRSVNKMAASFTSETVTSGFDKLAKVLPTVTDVFVKIVGWAMKHPVLGAAGFVAAKVGLAFGSGVITDSGKRLGNAAVDSILSKIKAQGPWASAGQALGVAAASYIAYEGGKMLIDELYKAKSADQGTAASAAANAGAAAMGNDTKAKEAQLVVIREKIAKMVEQQSTFTSSAGQLADKTFASLADIGASMGLNEKIAAPEDPLATMRAAEKELSDSLVRQREAKMREMDAANKTTRSLESLTEGADNLGKALQKVGANAGGSGNGKGPPKGLHTGPGYAQ
jgi:hypothetical protein